MKTFVERGSGVKDTPLVFALASAVVQTARQRVEFRTRVTFARKLRVRYVRQ